MTTFADWIKKTPKTWTDASVVRIAPPADLDRNDLFVLHPSVPRLFIRFRRAGDGTFGTGTYTAVYARGGKDHRRPIGKVGAISVDDAVQQAREIFAAAGDPTRDPRLEHLEAKAAHADVFKGLIPEYLKVLRSNGCKTRYVGFCERTLRRYFPDLADLQISLIRRAHCAAAITRLLTPGPAWKGGRGCAAFARAVLCAYFEWLIRQGKCEDNPVERTDTYAGQDRERTLTEAELTAVWRAIDPTTPTGRAFQLIVLTGCRRDQIGSLRAYWLDLDAAIPVIRFPGREAGNRADTVGDSKNGEAFTVPLARQAVALLRTQWEHNRGASEFVFGQGGAKGGFSGWSKAVDALRERVGDAVPHWTLHDLRRTFVTISNEALEQPRELLDACLNHKVGTAVSRIYNRAQLVEQRARAAQAWADYCDSLSAPAGPKLRLVAA